METYRVLIVDDSAFMRKTIGAFVETDAQFHVIGKARNGLDALEKLERLQPDLMTLDLEMPLLDGLTALKMIMETCPLPVVVITNQQSDIEKALQLGAVAAFYKQSLLGSIECQELFHSRLQTAMQQPTTPSRLESDTPIAPPVEPTLAPLGSPQKLLIIGSSTGGPAALHKILTCLPPTLAVPILIVQHMPPGFTKPLATRFNNACPIIVKEAEPDEILQKGIVYIAPAGIHTLLQKNAAGHYVVQQLETTMSESLYKPSIDVTVTSIAQAIQQDLTVMILTGMGDDGLKGCREVKKHGGYVITEAEESCVVYGMPKVVTNAGLADVQLPLDEMSAEIKRLYC